MDSNTPPEPALDASRQASAKKYARTSRYLSLLDYLLGALLLAVLLLSGLSRHLIDFLALPDVAGALYYFLILMAGYALITAPLDYYTGLVLPRRYGLSKQTPSGWTRDHLKSAGLGLLLGAALVALAYWLLAVSPVWWWLWGWGAVMLMSLVLSVLAPVVILPMFFKTKLLEEGEIKTRLENLALKAGVKIGGIYTIAFSAKTTTANAAVMGAGATRRILLSDTILNQYTPAEIEVVIGHEMGHQVHRDMARLFLFQAVLILASFYFSAVLFKGLVDGFSFHGIADPAALPLLVLVVGLLGMVLTPLTAMFTRFVEGQADNFALKITGDPDSFISAMARLTDQNLAEGTPPRWVEIFLEDHPSYRQRLASAQEFRSAE